MRERVTMWRLLSLAEPMTRMIPDHHQRHPDQHRHRHRQQQQQELHCHRYPLLIGGRNKLYIISWWRHQWKNFPLYFVRGIHRWPVDSPHRGQWRGALMFSFICICTNGWANNRGVGDLRRHCAYYDVTVMITTACALLYGPCMIVPHKWTKICWLATAN